MASNSLALVLLASVAPAFREGPLLQLPWSLRLARLPASEPTRSDGSSGFLDPADFSKKGHEAGSRNHRADEIKHGKLAMMAALGGVAQRYI
jgi:hypothetical protein